MKPENNPRIVFMGSPEFALPTLAALHQHFKLVGIVTQPDKPAGRGRRMTPPPVKIYAEKHQIPVIQPRKLTLPDPVRQIELWNPDLIVVAAYGKILRENVLNIPKYGCINVHASLLPRWRGAAPIQAAILNGDSHSGCTIMLMDKGMDTGAILKQVSEPIRADDTAATLAKRLAEAGARLLIETIPAFLQGEIIPIHQDNEQATYAPMIKKSDGELDISQHAEILERKIRAYTPWPGTFIRLPGGKTLKIIQAHVVLDESTRHAAFIRYHNRYPAIATPSGILVLDVVQPAGKKPMQGDQFLRGARDWGKE